MHKLVKLVSIDKSRISGNGGFAAPKKSDIGRMVEITRQCITWDGCLGHFITPDNLVSTLSGEEPTNYAFYNEELEEVEG